MQHLKKYLVPFILAVILAIILCSCSVRYTTGKVKKIENNLVYVNGEWFEMLDSIPKLDQEVKIYFTPKKTKVNCRRL